MVVTEIRIANHQEATPQVELVDKINATELLSPGDDGEMSSHKIWIPPNVSYPPHVHPAPHVLCILEGGGHAEVGDGPPEARTTRTLRQGDVFYVPGQTRHVVGADARGMIVLAVSVGSLALTDPERLVRVP